MNETVATASAEAPCYNFAAGKPERQRVWVGRGFFSVEDIPTDKGFEYRVLVMFPGASGSATIAHYRADMTRWFMLCDNRPDRDVEHFVALSEAESNVTWALEGELIHVPSRIVKFVIA